MKINPIDVAVKIGRLGYTTAIDTTDDGVWLIYYASNRPPVRIDGDTIKIPKGSDVVVMEALLS